MNDQFKFKVHEWIEWIAKAALVAILGLLWQLNIDVQKNLAAQSDHEKRLVALESTTESIKQAYVTRAEILETIKRVEMNQEIMMLRFKAEAAGRKEQR